MRLHGLAVRGGQPLELVLVHVRLPTQLRVLVEQELVVLVDLVVLLIQHLQLVLQIVVLLHLAVILALGLHEICLQLLQLASVVLVHTLQLRVLLLGKLPVLTGFRCRFLKLFLQVSVDRGVTARQVLDALLVLLLDASVLIDDLAVADLLLLKTLLEVFFGANVVVSLRLE